MNAVAMLEAALAGEVRPACGVEELEAQLHDPHTLVWQGERSVVMLHVDQITSTGERVLHVSPAAGDLQEILSAGVRDVETFARANGCTQIEVRAGRDGWERALRAHGYERTAVVLRKLL